MTMQERAEILPRLYKVQADLSVLYEQCRTANAVCLGGYLDTAKKQINEAIAEFVPETSAPERMEFPRTKF